MVIVRAAYRSKYFFSATSGVRGWLWPTRERMGVLESRDGSDGLRRHAARVQRLAGNVWRLDCRTIISPGDDRWDFREFCEEHSP